MRGGVLRGGVLRGCVLRGCDLRGCVLRGCVLRGCDLRGCVLRGGVLRGCVVSPGGGRQRAHRHDPGHPRRQGIFSRLVVGVVAVEPTLSLVGIGFGGDGESMG